MIKFNPLKRVALPGNDNAFVVEPSTGLVTAFLQALKEFPKLKEDQIDARYFTGLRNLICLFDGDRPFLAQYANSLHESDAAAWPLSFSETDTARQVLEAFDTSYLTRIVDAFVDSIGVTQTEELVELVRQVWPDREPAKN